MRFEIGSWKLRLAAGLVALVLGCHAQADVESRNKVLADSEALTTQGKFCEALMALKPLLKSPTHSTQQEQAIWNAHKLCKLISNSGELEKRASAAKPEGRLDDWYDEYEEVVQLNRLGVGLHWSHWGGYFADDSLFERLVRDYPESRFRPAAEFYLIEPGYDERKEVDGWIARLEAYIRRYSRLAIPEVARAQLTVALICDDLCFRIHGEPWGSADAAKDKADAEAYRQKALKYYARFLMSGFAEPVDDGHSEGCSAEDRLRDLPEGKPLTFVVFISGC